MALVACKECGAKVSTSAKACQACGAPPPKRTSLLAWFMVAVLVLVAIKTCASLASGGAAPKVAAKSPAQLAEEARRDKEARLVLAGARWLKDSMKKPESFELLSAGLADGKTACYEYKARNSFNDVKKEIRVIGDAVNSNRAQDWNKFCAGRPFTDYTYVRQLLD